MLSIIFFVWAGIKMEMPPVWFILCGIYIISWLMKIIYDFTKDE